MDKAGALWYVNFTWRAPPRGAGFVLICLSHPVGREAVERSEMAKLTDRQKRREIVSLEESPVSRARSADVR